MIRRIAALLFVMHGLVACGSATHGEVQHPEAGDKGTSAYCSNASPEENNCMRCSSKPGCGWCATPKDAASSCQPGVSGDASPATCDGDLSIGSDGCALPPPVSE
jgi:hypothetical protein